MEFGTKPDVSISGGWTRVETCSFDAYNEAGNLQEIAERFFAREGRYPSRIPADKLCRNRDSLRYCKERGIRLPGPALNLRRIQRVLLDSLALFLFISIPKRKLGVIQ